MRGKSALITGSTSGIGLAIARAMARAGARVALNGFGDASAIEEARASIERDFGVEAIYLAADVGKADDVMRMVRAAEEALFGVDVLVNNAGIQFVATVEEFPVDKWDAILATNLSAAFYAIHHALPGMKRRGWGRIVNIASAHGLVASAKKAAYVAAKHGTVGLTKVVGLEAAGSGVTCNAICPGWVLTPLVQRQIDDLAARAGVSNEEAERRLLAEKQPSQQFVTTDQIAELALFLCSDAAAQITGAALPIDGGWTAQ